MDKRESAERVLERMYRHYERSSGSTPDAKTVRDMEKRVRKAAETAENKKARRWGR